MVDLYILDLFLEQDANDISYIVDAAKLTRFQINETICKGLQVIIMNMMG